MPLYTLTCLDKPNSLEVRMAARSDHLAFAKELGERLKLGGPLLDEAGQMVGSLLIVEAEDRAAVDALAAADPYTKAGLFERVEIRPFRVTVGQL